MRSQRRGEKLSDFSKNSGPDLCWYSPSTTQFKQRSYSVFQSNSAFKVNIKRSSWFQGTSTKLEKKIQKNKFQKIHKAQPIIAKASSILNQMTEILQLYLQYLYSHTIKPKTTPTSLHEVLVMHCSCCQLLTPGKKSTVAKIYSK